MLFLTSQLPFSAKIFSRPLPPPKKSSSSEREYLRISEVKAIMSAAKKVGRHGVRDAALILLMFRHGLRTAELYEVRQITHNINQDSFSSCNHNAKTSNHRATSKRGTVGECLSLCL